MDLSSIGEPGGVRKVKRGYLERAVADVREAIALLHEKGGSNGSKLPYPVAEQLAPAVVLAARLEALEDAIVNGLPTAGEGI